MICERCGKSTHVIFITRNYERICDYCEEKRRKKSVHEIDGKKCKKVIDNMIRSVK